MTGRVARVERAVRGRCHVHDAPALMWMRRLVRACLRRGAREQRDERDGENECCENFPNL